MKFTFSFSNDNKSATVTATPSILERIFYREKTTVAELTLKTYYWFFTATDTQISRGLCEKLETALVWKPVVKLPKAEIRMLP